MLTFDVNVTLKDLRHYMFCHKYKRLSGIIELVLGLGCLIYGAVNVATIDEKWQPYMLFLIFFGIFFLVISPIQTCTKAARQYLANPAYEQPFTYVFDEEGIVVAQNGETANLPWGQVYKVVDNGRSIVVYISKFSANILPKRCFEKEYDELVKILKDNLDEKKLKL